MAQAGGALQSKSFFEIGPLRWPARLVHPFGGRLSVRACVRPKASQQVSLRAYAASSQDWHCLIGGAASGNSVTDFLKISGIQIERAW